jgi:hypothetical protein
MKRIVAIGLGAALILASSAAWAGDRPQKHVLSDAELDGVTAGLASVTVAVAASSSGEGAYAFTRTRVRGIDTPYVDIAVGHGFGVAAGSESQNVDVFASSTAEGWLTVNRTFGMTLDGPNKDIGVVRALAIAITPPPYLAGFERRAAQWHGRATTR